MDYLKLEVPAILSVCIKWVYLIVCSGDAWARAVSRQTLVGVSSAAIHWRRNMFLCSEHFANNAYYCPQQPQSSLLLDTAIPTLKLYRSSVQTPTPPQRPYRSRSPTNPIPKSDTPSEVSFTPVHGRPAKSRLQLQSDSRFLRRKLCEYQKTVAVLQSSLQSALACNRRILCRGVSGTFRRRRAKPKINCLCDKLHRLPTMASSFIVDTLCNVESKRPTWSRDSIILATGLYHYSPRTARYLRCVGLPLPSRWTVKRNVGRCLQKPGPCVNVQAAL